tara:strand:- start:3673 stop:3837 length:165 start_codon:yes stop_codon:yes gene_type:complete
MKVGDLVKFKNNGMIGLVVKVVAFELGEHWYRISWADGHVGNRLPDELEVVSAS